MDFHLHLSLLPRSTLETIFIMRILCFYKLLFHLLHIKLNKTGILDKFYVFLDKFFALLKVRGSAVTTII